MSEIIRLDERHLPSILAIYNEAIVHTTALYDYAPRTPEMIADWYAKKLRGNYPVLGLEAPDGTLLGFATYGPFRAPPAYKYTVEHSVYVECSHRGRGIGRKLMVALIEAAGRQDYHTMIGAIDAENAISIDFHRRLGFFVCGTVRQSGFKFGRWLDLVLMQLVLPTPERPVDG